LAALAGELGDGRSEAVQGRSSFFVIARTNALFIKWLLRCTINLLRNIK
jgi:hypothetical protein